MSNVLQPGRVPAFTIADRLRKARELTGLDQQTFAKEIEVSRDTVSNYESEDYPRKRQNITLRMWALRTGVPVEWLKTGVAQTQEDPGPGISQTPGQTLPRQASILEPSDSRLWHVAA